jgi:hypothetical protein
MTTMKMITRMSIKINNDDGDDDYDNIDDDKNDDDNNDDDDNDDIFPYYHKRTDDSIKPFFLGGVDGCLAVLDPSLTISSCMFFVSWIMSSNIIILRSANPDPKNCSRVIRGVYANSSRRN